MLLKNPRRILKNPEIFEEYTKLQRIATAVLRRATISYNECEDSTKLIASEEFKIICEESRKACEESRKL